MTAETQPRLKITYATLRNDNDELHAQFEAGLAKARGELLGDYHRNFVGGRERDGDGTFEKRSPIDAGGHGHVRQGHAQGRPGRGRGGPRARSRTGAAGRGRSASRCCARWPTSSASARWSSSALLAIEVGKNRLEALGDVEETADLIRWSCDMVEKNDGFDHAMGNLGDAAVHTRSVLKPYGVWGVISPFNFPFALSGGPSGGALVAGNTVVYKPSSDAPLAGQCCLQAIRDGGHPGRRLQHGHGPGRDASAPRSRRTTASTGSSSPARSKSGWHLYKNFARRYPKPVIVEMGGKNPAIVSRHADLDEAAEGVMRSAFGFSGQKCSANSRVYVERPVLAELHRACWSRRPRRSRSAIRSIARTGSGRSSTRRRSSATPRRSARRARTAGCSSAASASPRTGSTAATSSRRRSSADLPADHRLFRDELFVPFTAIAGGRLDRRGAPARPTRSISA